MRAPDRHSSYAWSMDVVDWLLDSDPSVRWQVLRDLNGAPPDMFEVERARVGTEGWGSVLLGAQGDDGMWDGGSYRPGWAQGDRPFFDAWTATHFSLMSLRDFGLDPNSPSAVRAVGLVSENVRWDATGGTYFQGETEPCINGAAVAVGAWFGQDVDTIVERLVADRLPDGGWNCWAEFGATVSSFHSTMCVLEGLLAWEHAGGESADVSAARRSGEEYLLERSLFRRRSDGEIIDPRFTMFSYPTRWYYDVLRGLEHFRSVGGERDTRLSEAVDLVWSKRGADGRWVLENVHQGPTWFEMEGPEGFPSRWNTLRALRVLKWWGGS